MADVFDSPRLMIASAHKGIGNLDKAFQLFREMKPYGPAVDYEPDTGYDVHKIKLLQALDPQLSVDVVHVAGDLRSALDQIGYATAIASGTSASTKTAFPFAAVAGDLDKSMRGRSKDLRPEIQALFRSFQPYKGGNEFLWAINELANGGKHRIIQPVGHGINGPIQIHNCQFEGMTRGFKYPFRWDTAKDEIELFATRQGAKCNYNINLAIDIAFGDIEVVSGKPVIGVLREQARGVEQILHLTIQLCRQLGLVQ